MGHGTPFRRRWEMPSWFLLLGACLVVGPRSYADDLSELKARQARARYAQASREQRGGQRRATNQPSMVTVVDLRVDYETLRGKLVSFDAVVWAGALWGPGKRFSDGFDAAPGAFLVVDKEETPREMQKVIMRANSPSFRPLLRVTGRLTRGDNLIKVEKVEVLDAGP